MENSCKLCKFCSEKSFEDISDDETKQTFSCNNEASEFYQVDIFVLHNPKVFKFEDGRVEQTCPEFVTHG
jgi:hypothetical protein